MSEGSSLINHAGGLLMAPVSDAVALDPATFLPKALAVQDRDEDQPWTRRRTVHGPRTPVDCVDADTLGTDESCIRRSLSLPADVNSTGDACEEHGITEAAPSCLSGSPLQTAAAARWVGWLARTLGQTADTRAQGSAVHRSRCNPPPSRTSTCAGARVLLLQLTPLVLTDGRIWAVVDQLDRHRHCQHLVDSSDGSPVLHAHAQHAHGRPCAPGFAAQCADTGTPAELRRLGADGPKSAVIQRGWQALR